MAEEDKGTSSWYKVPTWSGDPSEWRSFKREMEWWLASLDPESCKKYNVAARWAPRQSGVVRARCEEFDPADLKGTTEVRRADPDTGAEVVAEEADPFSGIRKLLSALEASMGRTEMDRKAELRKQFYQTIRRSAGERISTFCTRYRTLIGEMRREGITLPAGELGWFLKDRLGLDALRIQLLDTALQGKEDYEEVEREVLRLFRDLHVSDPLYKSTSRLVGMTTNPTHFNVSFKVAINMACEVAPLPALDLQSSPSRLPAPTVLEGPVPLLAAALRPMWLKMQLKLSLRAMRS